VAKKSLPLSKVYQTLEPGPVVMVTTAYRRKMNVMAMSWHMMIDFEPPILGCVISSQNHTFNLLKQSKECVINIPTVELAEKVVGVGNTTGAKVDKFEKFHLLYEAGDSVQAPLLTECHANLECKVIDAQMSEKYNLFILEVVKAWIRPSRKRARMIHHCGNGVFVIDGSIIALPSEKK
jgi:flavin reductase (DIM6/NTAB) family NADH-FMN oxidoreductase RutF